MCFNLDLEVALKIDEDEETAIYTVREVLNLIPDAKSAFDSLPTITKEQFYDLTVPTE